MSEMAGEISNLQSKVFCRASADSGIPAFSLNAPALLLGGEDHGSVTGIQVEFGLEIRTAVRVIQLLLDPTHLWWLAHMGGFPARIPSSSVIFHARNFPKMFNRSFWSDSLLECWSNSAGCESYSSGIDGRANHGMLPAVGFRPFNALIRVIFFMISRFRLIGRIVLNAGVAVLLR